MKDGDNLTSVNGKKLSIKVIDGKVSIGDTAILAHPTKIPNGVVHSADTVMV